VNAPLSILDFARVVLPDGCGLLVMLTAYFDDSGTHDDSEVVIWAGVCGNQYQWQAFSDDWHAKLQVPSPGKSPLSRFHMTDCQGARNEFEGWSRTATDFLVHELGEIIIKKGLWGYASAARRKDWDELITGDARAALGDAEGFCVRNVYVKTTDWAKNWAGGTDLAFVFDDRPHRRLENKTIFDMFQRHHRAAKQTPELVSITFASSQKILPLQAADMIAWELYIHSMDIFYNRTTNKSPLRSQLKRFNDSGRFRIQLATRKNIEDIAKQAETDQSVMKMTADYLREQTTTSASARRRANSSDGQLS
jgi:hypothetical protein